MITFARMPGTVAWLEIPASGEASYRGQFWEIRKFAVEGEDPVALARRLDRAEQALKRAGFIDRGALDWEPPIKARTGMRQVTFERRLTDAELGRAAPVQAQEPVVDKLSYDAQIDEWAIEKSNLEREIEELKSRAPAAQASPTDEQIALLAYEKFHIVAEDSEIVEFAREMQRLAAQGDAPQAVFYALTERALPFLPKPAAQGDAKDAGLIAELRSVYSIYNGHGEDLRDLAERAANRIAAIAAKAAS